jgi:hypothetical protein
MIVVGDDRKDWCLVHSSPKCKCSGAVIPQICSLMGWRCGVDRAETATPTEANLASPVACARCMERSVCCRADASSHKTDSCIPIASAGVAMAASGRRVCLPRRAARDSGVCNQEELRNWGQIPIASSLLDPPIAID